MSEIELDKVAEKIVAVFYEHSPSDWRTFIKDAITKTLIEANCATKDDFNAGYSKALESVAASLNIAELRFADVDVATQELVGIIRAKFAGESAETTERNIPTSSTEMRARSGEVDSDDPLVGFLYILMRDHLTAGEVENIMELHIGATPKVYRFSNGWLASHAKDLARRLCPESVHAENIEGTQEGCQACIEEAEDERVTLGREHHTCKTWRLY